MTCSKLCSPILFFPCMVILLVGLIFSNYNDNIMLTFLTNNTINVTYHFWKLQNIVKKITFPRKEWRVCLKYAFLCMSSVTIALQSAPFSTFLFQHQQFITTLSINSRPGNLLQDEALLHLQNNQYYNIFCIRF